MPATPSPPDPAGYSGPERRIGHRPNPRVRRKRRSSATGRSELGLTSMIDVIFQLLIYFVVTANFMIGEGVLDAALPAGPPEPVLPEDALAPLFIDLEPDGSVGVLIRVDETQPVTGFADLHAYLWESLDDPEAKPGLGLFPPHTPVIIRPAGRVRWQHVVDAFNAVVRARYTNVSFARPDAL
ncbi:MAG: biopolymer transporter ExbD [Planctomycetota bacterium]